MFPEELRPSLEVPRPEGTAATLGALDETAFRLVDRAVALDVDAEGFWFFRDIAALRAHEETMQARTVKPDGEAFRVHLKDAISTFSRATAGILPWRSLRDASGSR